MERIAGAKDAGESPLIERLMTTAYSKIDRDRRSDVHGTAYDVATAGRLRGSKS
jgi:hypothetical protein